MATAQPAISDPMAKTKGWSWGSAAKARSSLHQNDRTGRPLKIMPKQHAVAIVSKADAPSRPKISSV
jgi:hypothetical protein